MAAPITGPHRQRYNHEGPGPAKNDAGIRAAVDKLRAAELAPAPARIESTRLGIFCP